MNTTELVAAIRQECTRHETTLENLGSDYHEDLLEAIGSFDASLMKPYYESRANRD